jgi:hypothetical protein
MNEYYSEGVVIVVNTAFVALHCWPEANGKTSYLKDFHRHKFTVRCEKPIQKDREIEFIEFKEGIDKYITANYANLYNIGDKSCEKIANELSTAFGLSLCEVMEDGENGAIVRRFYEKQ